MSRRPLRFRLFPYTTLFRSATVISTTNGEGELMSAVGVLAPAQGRRFALAGSLAQDVLQSRQVAIEEDLGATQGPLATRLKEVGIDIGPLVMAPLVAHEETLGVLAVARDRRSVPFTTRETQRL